MSRLALVFALTAAWPVGCGKTVTPGSANANAMGDWVSWGDLTPLVKVAETHAPKPTVQALREASGLLRDGKALSADRRLAQVAGSEGRHWIAVARADLAALFFTVCIRGVAWRLENEKGDGTATERRVDFDEETRIEPGDVSVEALLTNLDAAMASGVPALVSHARIARARVTAFASRCAPNPNVRTRAEDILESDLATLAAEGSLTPDLAFMWGGIQMTRYSSAAARPFLLQAQEGGFDDAAVVYMLAIAALDQRELEGADALAKEAESRFKQAGDRGQQAEAAFLRGEVARAHERVGQARQHYNRALKLFPEHMAALLGLTTLARDSEGANAAVDYLHSQLEHLFGLGAMDEPSLRGAAERGESLVILATEPETAQIVRDAMLQDIDGDDQGPRRGLRYFFAAALEARLAEYEMARGHAILARDEFNESDTPSPVDIDAFIGQLTGG